MYIFLDIDGVLVKDDEVPIDDVELWEAVDAKFDPVCLQEFETVIRQYPNTKIVISSAWREMFTLAEIKSRFSDDVANLIVGVTPLAKSVQKFYRHQEVLDYLNSNHLTKVAWVAIDDFASHFPINWLRMSIVTMTSAIIHAIAAYLRADWLFRPDWQLNWSTNWIANRQRPEGDTRSAIADYTMTDLTLRYRGGKTGGVELGIGIQNLFDTEAREPFNTTLPNDWPLAGRSLWGDVRYRF